MRVIFVENSLKLICECMVALPKQLFTNTQIPACIWFLTKDKQMDYVWISASVTAGETLFIDARNLGFMKDRVLRDFTPEDIAKVADTYHAWQDSEGYENEAGFCFSAKLEDIIKNDFVLTPGRYVGAAEAEDDGEPFADKMLRLTKALKGQFEEGQRLEGEIKKNLAGIGYDF